MKINSLYFQINVKKINKTDSKNGWTIKYWEICSFLLQTQFYPRIQNRLRKINKCRQHLHTAIYRKHLFFYFCSPLTLSILSILYILLHFIDDLHQNFSIWRYVTTHFLRTEKKMNKIKRLGDSVCCLRLLIYMFCERADAKFSPSNFRWRCTQFFIIYKAHWLCYTLIRI